MRSEKNLKELVGEFIGIQWAGVARGITAKIPANKATKEAARTVTGDVVRGRVFQFNTNGDDGEYLGETLVFQSVLAADLNQKKSDWFVGVLTETPQRGDESRSVYTLEPPAANAGEKFDAAEQLLLARGLDG
jgi:hypothetical protein